MAWEDDELREEWAAYMKAHRAHIDRLVEESREIIFHSYICGEATVAAPVADLLRRVSEG